MIVLIVLLIIKDNKILIMKDSDKWELPGAIQMPLEGDSFVIRSILMQKLGIEPLIDKYLGTASFEYKGVVMQMKIYLVPSYMGDIILYDNQAITWIAASDAESYELCDLDKEILKLL